MTGQVNFDIDYKALIKEKFLDAYENNPLVLEKILQLANKANLDSQDDFLNYFYLAGVIVSLCPPEVTNLILLGLELDRNINHVLYTLGLNFDPRPELEKRAETRNLAQEVTLILENNAIEDPEYRAVQEGLEEIRSQMKQLENSS